MFSRNFLEKLSQSIEEVESVSSVELVVVASPSSGNYRDVDRQTGFLFALTLLLVAVHSPLEFAPDLLVFWAAISYFIGIALSERIPRIRKLFVSQKRLRGEAEFASRYYFHDRKLTHTRERTGLMLYLSCFERTGVLIPDVGVEAKLSSSIFHELEHAWAKCRDLADFEKSVLDGLKSIERKLGEALPRPEDDENELPNEILVVTGGAR